MENLPESLFVEASGTGPSTSGENPNVIESKLTISLEQLIMALQKDRSREQALLLLSKVWHTEDEYQIQRAIQRIEQSFTPFKRVDSFVRHLEKKDEGLAPMLWNSFGTIFTLLQEIIGTYHILSSPDLVARASSRVCNAVVLLQYVASHQDTRMPFLKANIPFYLYPLLCTTNKEIHYEHLRLTSLGVIGALVKVDDAEVIHFLLKSEVFPCCLHCMEVGNKLTKTVATFIVQKILMHEEGLKYCCTFAERFFAVSRVLGTMVEELAKEPSARLLKQIIRCYLRLSESPRTCDGLRYCLPIRLKDATLFNLLHDDPTAMGWLQQLFYNISTLHQSTTQPVGELYGRRLIRSWTEKGHSSITLTGRSRA